MEDGYSNLSLVGIGKSQHLSSLGNWTNANDASVCADGSANSTWSDWGASQRELFVLDHLGNVVLEQSVTGGLPGNLEELIIQLINEAPDCDPSLVCGEAVTCWDDGLLYPTTCGPENCDESIGTCLDCDPDLMCGDAVTCWDDGLLYPTTCGPENCDEPIGTCLDCDPDLICGGALTCVDGLLYPTTCGPDNCDEPIDTCEEDECIDGEVNNDNPCNPMECFDGQWFEIVIDCAEQMGVPCQGGVYVDPPEGVCCSTCVSYGDINGDNTLNVVDVVQIINIILSDGYNVVADVNTDGSVNVVDVVVVVNILLNGLP